MSGGLVSVAASIEPIDELSGSWGSVAACVDEEAPELQPASGDDGLGDVVFADTRAQKRRRGRPSISSKSMATVLQVVPASGSCMNQAMPIISGSATSHMTGMPSSSMSSALEPCCAPAQSAPKAPRVASYLRPSLSGHCQLSILSQGLHECHNLSMRQDWKRDEDYTSLYNCYVSDGNTFHNRSMVVRAEELGMNRSTVEAKLLRLASAHSIFCRMEWALFLQHLRSNLSSPQLVLFLDFMAYDETPMKTKVVDPALPTAAAASPSHRSVPHGMDSAVVEGELSVTSSSTTTKILQCRHICGVVLRVGDRLISFFGEVPCQLQ
eukprot:4818405-Amphidinium_carterae.1